MSTEATQEIMLPILTILQRIKEGMVDPRTIDKETRQACVEALLGEGASQTQIAVHLKHCDKTIQRDVQEIRKKNAVNVTPEFVTETIGDMISSAQQHHARLIQLAKNSSASTMERAQAELYAWTVKKDCVTKLQTLGCLPQKAQEVIGDVFHHKAEEDEEESFEALDEMIKDITQMTKGKKDSKNLQISRAIRQEKSNLERIKVAANIKKISREVKGHVADQGKTD
jgi:hypothetical protein